MRLIIVDDYLTLYLEKGMDVPIITGTITIPSTLPPSLRALGDGKTHIYQKTKKYLGILGEFEFA